MTLSDEAARVATLRPLRARFCSFRGGTTPHLISSSAKVRDRIQVSNYEPSSARHVETLRLDKQNPSAAWGTQRHGMKEQANAWAQTACRHPSVACWCLPSTVQRHEHLPLRATTRGLANGGPSLFTCMAHGRLLVLSSLPIFFPRPCCPETTRPTYYY